MVIGRGEIWWANLPEPVGSGPGYRHPVLVIQADFLNETRINTVIVSAITTNLELGEMPGNVVVTERTSGLFEESVVNVTQIITIDKRLLLEYVGTLSER